MFHILSDVKVGDRVYDVEFDAVNFTIGNSGIGSYEYWGSRGYDRGHDFVEEFDVKNLKVYDSDTGDPAANVDLEAVKHAIFHSDEICEDINDKWAAERLWEKYEARYEGDR